MRPTSHPQLIRRSLRVLALGLLFSASSILSALPTDPATLKLFGRWTGTLANSFQPLGYALGRANVFGPSNSTLAATENWILVGAVYADEQATDQGAVQVFNAVTGAWVRKLLPPPPITADANFGSACAISGNTAVIGSFGPAASSPGVAYVYNLTNGKLLRTLKPNLADGAVGDKFGTSIAISGSRVLVGAHGEDSEKGSAYIFDLNTGAQLFKMQGTDSEAGDLYGAAVAAEGNIGVVGSMWEGNNRGAVYAYDLSTGALINRYQATASADGDSQGYSVALSQGKLVIGAPYANSSKGKVFVLDLLTSVQTTLTASDATTGDYFGRNVCAYQGMLLAGMPYQNSYRGACYVYDLNSVSTTEFRKLLSPDLSNSEFGEVAVWSGNTAVLVAPFDDTQANNAGALYLMRPITRPMPLTKVTAKGDFAPGAPDIDFNLWSDAYLNSEGEIAFSSSLTGFGSNAKKDTGIWNTLAVGKPLELVLKSRQVDGGPAILSVSKPLINQQTTCVFQALLTGAGVTAKDNQAIYKDNGTATTRILRTGGGPSALFGGGVPLAFTQVVQSKNSNRILTTFTLQQGVASTDAGKDSGLLWFDVDTLAGETTTPREGSAAAATGLTYGQFTGRIACFYDRALYATAVVGPPASNQAIFAKTYDTAETLLARKGDVPPAPGGAPFSGFIGEAVEDTPVMLYRATLGAPASAANNEGLWSGPTASSTLILRKGDALPGLPSVKIAKFINFWVAYGQTLALVQLSGTGVTAANDQALLLRQPGETEVLIREGEAAAGCNGATIGVISRVEVETWNGQYGVLATLVGAPLGTDQALFRGFSRRAVTATEKTLHRPVPVLRKGALFDNQPSKIKSISLANTNLTAAGSGTTGLGRAFQEASNTNIASAIVLTIDFENGVRQLMQGIP